MFTSGRSTHGITATSLQTVSLSLTETSTKTNTEILKRIHTPQNEVIGLFLQTMKHIVCCLFVRDYFGAKKWLKTFEASKQGLQR